MFILNVFEFVFNNDLLYVWNYFVMFLFVEIEFISVFVNNFGKLLIGFNK